ncbi:RNA polymerase sigma factor [Hymenobacter sp. GOD-10R]|uniref:RNA polymerase sigma factor n=1 Tax=Hymenobacter sp. GOD-10R TaxID=3093922 RepID=UPI002D77CFBA|nr:sigma-70 family RNA polymerase sigma factor [Hymenobacter sp. GOD-10R]WRQ31652.1 sigma-70 family RNA polymerase sigma factor [Hymenobacter sp. GOD-10R]
MPAVDLEAERTLSERARQDWTLVQAALLGRQAAYAELLQRYHRSVYHVLLKMVRTPEEAEDLAQEVFVKAFRRLTQYQPLFAFSTWLLRITTNHGIDFLRRKKRIVAQSLHTPLATGDEDKRTAAVRDPVPDPQEQLIRQQRVELVQRVVERLPARYARLVRLHYFQELNYEEIAAALHLPVGTVKASLFRARALLVELLPMSREGL